MVIVTNQASVPVVGGEVEQIRQLGPPNDGFRDVQNEVQKLTDRFVKSIDDHLKHKEAEIMKV